MIRFDESVGKKKEEDEEMGEADEEGWITVTSSSKLQVHIHLGLKLYVWSVIILFQRLPTLNSQSFPVHEMYIVHMKYMEKIRFESSTYNLYNIYIIYA